MYLSKKYDYLICTFALRVRRGHQWCSVTVGFGHLDFGSTTQCHRDTPIWLFAFQSIATVIKITRLTGAKMSTLAQEIKRVPVKN